MLYRIADYSDTAFSLYPLILWGKHENHSIQANIKDKISGFYMNVKNAFITLTRFLNICFVFILFTFFTSTSAIASDPIDKIKKLITSQDAFLLASPDGKIIFSKNADKKLIPASTLKVLTSLVAIHFLGENYKFPTDFYIDADANLIIKGYGDPLLISEEIIKIAPAIKTHTDFINHIILDDTFFEKPLTIPGTVMGSLQPYDAPNGALCVNFNTVNFKIINKTIVSAESQTPIVDIARKKIKSVNSKSGRILLTNNSDEITRYAGEIFYYFLKKQGIKIKGSIQLGKVNYDNDKLIYRYLSQFDLSGIISRLLEYSNNFMANQILLTTGAKVFGAPATIEKGIKAAKKFVSQRFDIKDAGEISFVEGSGISRNNQLTAQTFLKLLHEFKPYHDLMKNKDNQYYKTGTLNGIHTRVGYIVSATNELYPFIVFINTPGKTTEPVMKQLKKLVQ
jgi:D-alanyl-D-alanine carboxypeptidase/D-alanyl-D-alanine-endopeptidase (penicillin-binding protein 4)